MSRTLPRARRVRAGQSVLRSAVVILNGVSAAFVSLQVDTRGKERGIRSERSNRCLVLFLPPRLSLLARSTPSTTTEHFTYTAIQLSPSPACYPSSSPRRRPPPHFLRPLPRPHWSKMGRHAKNNTVRLLPAFPTTRSRLPSPLPLPPLPSPTDLHPLAECIRLHMGRATDDGNRNEEGSPRS